MPDQVENTQENKSFNFINRFKSRLNHQSSNTSIVVGLVAIAFFLFIASIAPTIGRKFGFISDKKQNQQSFASTPYVVTNGRSLSLNGLSYRLTGVNRYNLLTNNAGGGYQGCGGTWTEAEIETWLTELEAQGVNTVRLWTFQKFIYEGNIPYWGRFEYVLSRAFAHNIKIIPVLENQWDDNAPAKVTDCTEGGFKTEDWYRSGYLVPNNDGVGSGHAFSLKDYVATIVTRYKDDARIAFWQVMNEAEIKTSAGSCGSATIFRLMADDIATDIQAIDSNHLVSFGTLGAGQCGTQGADYKALHALPSIDLCEYHDYGHNTEAMPTGGNLLSTRISQCTELNKPIFIGEAGIQSTLGLQQRADLFNSKIGAFYNAGGVGYLIWSYRDRNATNAPWDYNALDPLAAVVARYKLPTTNNTDQISPTVTLTAPTNSSTVSGTVNVTADASDNVAVTKVEFLIDGAVKGADTSSPYAYVWDTTTVVNGSHTISAKAFDAAGITQEKSVSVNVVQAQASPITTTDTDTDTDGDGYSDIIENYLGTNPNTKCSQTAKANDEDVDNWPPDINDDKAVSLADVVSIGSAFNKSKEQPGFNKRFDLNNSGTVDNSDIELIRPYYNTKCQ